MLVYITKSNFSKIVRKIPLNNVNLEGQLYPKYNIILDSIFSKFEKTELLLYKMLSEEPKKFLDEIYSKISEKEDTYTWVYEKQKSPCYHGKSDCPRLTSPFENYKIPLPIKYKGIHINKPFENIVFKELSDLEQNIVLNNVKSYRNWWKVEGEYLYKSDIDTFLMRVNMKFQPEPRITDLKEFKQKNSGIIEFDNCTLIEIEEKIDKLIIDQRNYFYANEMHLSILRHYVKQTYQVLVKDDIPKFNSCIYSDDEIKSVLEEYREKYKEPLRNLLRNYFRIKNNPELKIESKILDELGLVPCSCVDCYYDNKDFAVTINKRDDYNLYLDFFLNEAYFAKTYISMYYPFTYDEILERWEFLIHGDAHYSIYIDDIESSIKPQLGLSFNNEIRWNSKLKAKYEYGFIDPFRGYIVGTHKGCVEFEERDYLDDMLPLNVINEANTRNDIMFDWFLRNRDCEYNDLNLFDMDLVNKQFPYLTYEEFKNIFDMTPYVFLFNKSLWGNTFSKIINLEFCDKVLGYNKIHQNNIIEELPY